MAIAAGVSTQVLVINLTEHRLVDKWYIEDGINSLDHLCFPDGGIIFAFGTSTGKLLTRIDWEELPSSYDCRSMITAVKFSSDGYYMIATCLDKHLYVFTFSNGSYFQFPPKELTFSSEIPMSINLTDGNKMVLLSGHKGGLYKIDLPEMKYRTSVQESDRFVIKSLTISLTDENRPDRQVIEALTIMGNDLNYIILAGKEGDISVWKNLFEVQRGCGEARRHHCGMINSVAVSQYQNNLVTLGAFDGCLIDWQGNCV